MTPTQHLVPKPESGAVLTKAALRAADRLGLSGRQLAMIVGVSEATVSRWKRNESQLEPGSKPFELAALLVRASGSLDAITGGDEVAARRWLASANTALGAPPAGRMTQEQGLLDVTTYLDIRRPPL